MKVSLLFNYYYGRIYEVYEGRTPNLFVAAKVASATGDKSTYIKNRAFDDGYYKKRVLAYIDEYGYASRTDIDKS